MIVQSQDNLDAAGDNLKVIRWYAPACFYSHQAAEASLKALFSANGLRFSETHDLAKCMDGLHELYPGLGKHRKDAIFLNSFHITTRYEPRQESYDGTAPGRRRSKQDAEEALEAAAQIVKECQEIYGRMVLQEEGFEFHIEDFPRRTEDEGG